MTEQRPELAQERSLVVAWKLCDGERMTTRDIADCTGLSLRSAYRLMQKFVKWVPVRLDQQGRWMRDDSIQAPLQKRVQRMPPK